MTTYTSNDNTRRGLVNGNAKRDTQVIASNPSVWQGYVLLGIVIAIAYVLIAYVLPYLN